MTSSPRYLGPGWLLAFALGLMLWLAIYELWGACVVVVLLAAGTFGIVAVAMLLGDGRVDQLEDRR